MRCKRKSGVFGLTPALAWPMLALQILFISGCASLDKDGAGTSQIDIYVAGQANGSAVYWRNGQKTILSNERSNASSVFLSNQDVYVGGSCEENGIKKACYWKNGQKMVLGKEESAVLGIQVSGTDVYTVGWERGTSCYWKNSIKKPIYETEASANAISIAGADIYIAGTYLLSKDWMSSLWTACYWKNGDPVTLPSYGTPEVNAIQIQGGDIYAAGSSGEFASNLKIPCYWKNGTQTEVESGAVTLYVHGLFVSGNNVFLSGYYLNKKDVFVACYWKNEKKSDLPGTNSYAYDISVTGDGDVYVSGHSDSSSCYWKNGKKVELEKNAEGSGLFISEH